VRRAAIILLGLCLGCDSRNLVVITSWASNADTSESIADANGSIADTSEPIADASGSIADASGSTTHVNGHYHMENLDRGLVAVAVPNGVYLGWRMFGYEYDGQQPERIAYAVYRDGALLATVNDSTNFLDRQGGADSLYSVAAIVDGETQELSPLVNAWPQDYLRIPLQIPPAGVTPATCPAPNEHYTYSAGDASVGDLDGDGRYEIVLKWDPSNARDNAQYGCSGDVLLDAYTLDGQRLWRIDLGPNIRAGAHYTQHLVYDFDGEDGKAELVVKTAPGTTDGTGTNLKMGPALSDDQTAVYRNSSGYILTGPEYLTVFDGVTGAELATVSFQPARGAVADWGDTYGNRVDNLLSTAAFVRDQNNGTGSGRPSIIMGRGFYARTALSAWNWRDGALTRLWTADSKLGTAYDKQGAHSWAVADVDGDGTQEIITGSSTINGDGTRRCSTNLGYGLGLHVADLIPGRPGLEVFVPHMSGTTAYDEHDPNTCAIIVPGPAVSLTSRGVADDIYDGNDGGEMWTNNSGSLISATTGKNVGSLPSSTNFLIWWDADEARELEDQTSITKYGGAVLLNCPECASNNSTKATPVLSADLLGDWREEIIWREKDNSALRLYTTTDVTTRRIYALMHDPQYRMQVSSEQAGFNQPPHPSFHIGHNMQMPPQPDIFVRR
jgi:hypothetical protein